MSVAPGQVRRTALSDSRLDRCCSSNCMPTLQLANNEVVVPRFSWSFSFSYGGPNIAVVQRSKGLPKADEQAFSLF